MSEPAEKLIGLMQSYVKGDIDVADFCENYEKEYNFCTDKSKFSSLEKKTFSDLFDRIVWYSPFEKERKVIPNYIGEDQVRMSVVNAFAILGLSDVLRVRSL